METLKNILLLITIGGVFGLGCKQDVVCSSILIEETIQIVDQNDSPVSSVDLEIVNQRTGNTLCEAADSQDQRELCENELGEVGNSGTYVIVSSMNTGRYSVGDVKDGDVIIVTGTKGGVSFSQEYTVRIDSDRCHPEGIIGPEKIVLDITQ